MDFVYIDPGYGAGIDGTTYVENDTYNPINGVAFTGSHTLFSYPAVPSGIFSLSDMNQTKVVTLRLSAYLDFSGGKFSPRFDYIISGVGTGVLCCIEFNSASKGFFDIALSRYAKIENSKLSTYTIKDINGNITIEDQLTNIDSSVANNRAKAFGNHFTIQFPTAGECYVSNVMVTVGNEALSSGSFPVKLTLKNTSGDFISLGDGEYVGNSAGQKLLSVVDASDVITKFGASSKVSHLVSYGHPGYRVGANITNATGITEENSSIAAHGSCSLSTDTDASAAVAWAVDNTRLSDVDGMKIGWQV